MARKTKMPMGYTVRFMLARDAEEVLELERRCFEHPWTRRDMTRFLRQSTANAMVVDDGRTIVGYVLYLILRGKLDICTMGVDPAHRREGIGRALIEKLVSKMSLSTIGKLTTYVSERSLVAHQFLRSMEFRAVKTLRQYYSTGDDAYLFVRRYRKPAAPKRPASNLWTP